MGVSPRDGVSELTVAMNIDTHFRKQAFAIISL